MIYPEYTILPMLKVFIVFGFFYIFLPSRVIVFSKEADSFLDKVFISLTHSCFITVVIVYFLSFLKIYETVSLIFCCVLVYFIVTSGKGGTFKDRATALGIKWIVNILDMSEGRLGLKQEAKIRIRRWFKSFWKNIGTGVKNFFLKPFNGIFLFAVLVSAAYFRFNHALNHLYFGASDSYVHLAWTKYLGDNLIYQDGIYPYGYHSIISALNKIFFIDPYHLLRFLGPLAGFLIVLSIYYTVKASFKNIYTAWLAVFLYTFGLWLPSGVWRQISALPQEFAGIFFLPGIHFLNLFFKTEKRIYLFLACECLALTVFIHPYVTVFLAIGYILVMLVNLKKLLVLKNLAVTAVSVALSVVIGILPIILGFVLGYKPHSTSFGFIISSMDLSGKAGIKDGLVFTENNTVFLILLFSILLTVAFILAHLYMKRSMPYAVCTCFLLLSAALYLMYRANAFNLPVLMDSSRIGIFLSIAAVVAIPMPLMVIGNYWSKTSYLISPLVCIAVAVIVLSSAFISGKPYIPKGYQMEYDEAVFAYLDIKKNFETLEWTIISPVEQYSQNLGYGWHYELLDFAELVDDPESKDFTIPTNHVFIFVEKQPFTFDGSKRHVNREDAQKTLPEGMELANEYYMDADSRSIIESKVYYWAENYMKTHDNMRIYLDYDHFRVYHLTQDGSSPVNLLMR